MTRPRPASEAFVASLPIAVRDRLTPIYSPLIEIVRLNATVPMTADDAGIFTSANGVHAAPNGQGRIAFCVGTATTKAALDRGWAAQQTGTDADTLVAHLVTAMPTQRLFHLSGLHTRGDVAGQLTNAGLHVLHIALYDQRLRDLTDMAAQTIMREKRVIVPLFSPRTAAQFMKVAPRTTCVHALALSPAVAAAMGSAPLAGLNISPDANAQAMGATLCAAL